MRTSSFARRHAALLLVAVIGLGGCTSLATAPSPALQQQIDSAHTRADHQTLAERYDKEAADARGRAEDHRKMAKSYQGMMATGRGGASMPAHCNALARGYENIAAEYDGMAAAHRQMAEQAKP